jgi:CDP-diacylglycerol--glycerol-3-phosphate 3-phosphatidyltransferase
MIFLIFHCERYTISLFGRIMNLANLITILRIVLVPIFLVILLTEMENKEIFAFIVFIIASISDAFDGYIARKYDQVTELGKFLDPLADKLLISAALLALVYLQLVETWVAAVIILREFVITAFRFYFLVKDSTFSASWLAKKKTLFQIIAISVLILHNRLPGYEPYVFKAGTYVLYFATFLTIYSGIEYIIKYSKK